MGKYRPFTYAPVPALAYPNPLVTQAGATDTVTFNLQLSQIVTVVRFSLVQANPYIQPASIVIPIVVQPPGSIQGKVQPIFIAYEPPGDKSTFQYPTSQSGGAGVTIQTQYQVGSTNQNTTSQSFAYTPDLTGAIPGLPGTKVGVSANFGTSSSTTTLDTDITIQTKMNGITETWSNGNNITAGWPQAPTNPPGPANAPVVSPWTASTEYCRGGGSGAVN